MAALTVGVTWSSIPYRGADSEQYIELAKGRPENTIKPFSGRILHPTLVRGLSVATGLTIDQSFLAVGLAALVVLIFTLFLGTVGRGGSFWFATLPVIATPFLMMMFREYYLPDLFHAALLGIFLLIFIRHRVASLFVLLLLFLTRESTMLLAATIVLVALLRSDRRLALQIFLTTLLGVGIATLAGTYGKPNIHGMNHLFYMLFKAPFNLLLNMAGAQLWANTLDYCAPYITVPVPSWLHLGSIKTIGMCHFNSMRPLTTIALLLTTFGIAPTILSIRLVMERRLLLTEKPFWLAVAVVYGVLAYSMGAALGSSVYRLIGYGWPAFLLATPIMLSDYYAKDKTAFLVLVSCHIVTCWLSFALYFFPVAEPSTMLAVILSALILHALSIQMMYRRRLHTYQSSIARNRATRMNRVSQGQMTTR